MRAIRGIQQVFSAKPTIEGAGVRLKRVFGFAEAPALDPFLLLDDFHSDNPDDYLAGFPWHPHRGIETITYMLYGELEHQDSMGNKGVIGPGDVQWMTAGSGIIHQEMPAGDQTGMQWGFQLWANLPASHKMIPPRYREVHAAEMPAVELENGTRIKIICGRVGETVGPVTDIITEPEYLDVEIPPGAEFVHPVKRGHIALAYVIQGEGSFGGQGPIPSETAVLFEDGDEIAARAQADPVRFLLISGRPIGEPVAWRGPIVMNTREELVQAFDEYQAGTFIKHRV
jgi:quercetin 2,3-dioxygenase